MEFRTANGSTQFQVGEVIPLEVAFSSTSASRYLEPCELFIVRSFGFAICRFANPWNFEVSPSEDVVDLSKEFPEGGFRSGPSFEVPSHDLTQQPSTRSYPLTNRFRFDKPGQYRVRFTTEVGLDDETTQLTAKNHGFTRPSVKPHSVPITRELVLNIVPADPAWEASVIERGKQAFSLQGTRDIREAEYKKEESARLALCTLGSPDALRAMARLLAKDIPQGVRVCRDTTTGRPDCYETVEPIYLSQCIRQARDTSPAMDEMQKLLVAPDVAVKQNLFNLLVAVLGKDSGHREGMLIVEPSIADQIRDRLFAALPQKNSDTFIPSLVTLLSNPLRTRSNPAEFYHDLTFSPEIIATIAAHFEDLPYETSRLLLTTAWDRIRSPQMLPVVRHRAEVGDGDGLLRWLELDPQNATAFIRQEIARPIPRFSSYYLRLPDASLPSQEQQLADNFLALVPKYQKGYSGDSINLSRSASLLQRYATTRVLPQLQPTIDANLTKWDCAVQIPVLAYLLKVSPKDASSRIEHSLPTDEYTQCTNSFLTGIGTLQPSPVLERIALERVALGKGPLDRDAAEYLRQYASKQAKSAVWDLLVRLTERMKTNRTQEHFANGTSTAEDNQQLALLLDLSESYVAAQAWVLTPQEAEAYRKLVGDKQNEASLCRFACGGELSVAAHNGQFAIYGRATEAYTLLGPPLDYLNPRERLHYSVSQYRCETMQKLKDKLLQFPAGSEFAFAYDFTPNDRDELVEIASFLREHGYKVANPWKWPFLEEDAAVRQAPSSPQ